MENIKSAIIYLIAGLIFVVGGAYISSRLNKENTPLPIPPTPITRPVVFCPADFLSYHTLISESPNQVVELISERKSMFAANGDFINSEVIITKNETKTSKVACGYLFTRVGTQTHGTLQNWENLYVNPNEFGGHINSSNHFGSGDGRNFSEYLFSLKEIWYWKTRTERAKDDLSKADWAALLNVSERVSFIIALNTEDKTAFIDKFLIAYKCWDPQTGEENDQCKLEVETASDTLLPELR